MTRFMLQRDFFTRCTAELFYERPSAVSSQLLAKQAKLMKQEYASSSGFAHPDECDAFDQVLATFFCPDCGTSHKITLGWIRTNKYLLCRLCRVQILIATGEAVHS